MKKSIILLVAVFATLSLTLAACSKHSAPVSPETACWEGYDEIAFIDLINKATEYIFKTGTKEVFGVTNPNIIVNTTIEEGWGSSSILNKNSTSSETNKCYSYFSKGEFKTDDGVSTIEFIYFMEFDVEKEVLLAKGFCVASPDQIMEYRQDETIIALENAIKFVHSSQ